MRINKSIKSVITGLTVNEEAFAEMVAQGHNTYDAHCAVFGVGKAKRKSKVEMGTRLAKKSNIVAYMERIREETRAKGSIDRDQIISWLTDMAVFGTEKQQRHTATDSYESLKDGSAANSAIDKLIKMGGLYAAEKVETEVSVKGKFVLNLKDRTDT